jgi:hypothetical protein
MQHGKAVELGMTEDEVRAAVPEEVYKVVDEGGGRTRLLYRYSEDNIVDIIAFITTFPIMIPLCAVGGLEMALVAFVTLGIVDDGLVAWPAFKGLIDIYIPEDPALLRVHLQDGYVYGVSISFPGSKRKKPKWLPGKEPSVAQEEGWDHEPRIHPPGGYDDGAPADDGYAPQPRDEGEYYDEGEYHDEGGYPQAEPHPVPEERTDSYYDDGGVKIHRPRRR